jgi:hypothetical protein
MAPDARERIPLPKDCQRLPREQRDFIDRQANLEKDPPA